MTNPLVLITGASGTLGLALAESFLENGWDVIAGVRRDTGESFIRSRLKTAISDKRLSLLTLNGVDIAQASDTLAGYLSSQPLPDALINNAATDSWDGVEELGPEVFAEILQVNLVFPAMLAGILVKYWMDFSRSGSILHISSLLAAFGAHESCAYAASKGGLEAFSRALAVEKGPLGIRSNVLRIAGCEHSLTSRQEAITPESRCGKPPNESADVNVIPLRRRGRISDYCSAASFLLSPGAEFITGQVFTVDGGLSAVYPGYSPPGTNKE